MIQVASYLKFEEEFVPIEQYNRPIADADYIDGAIELTVNGAVVMDEICWDLVDQLWHYIVSALEELNIAEAAETTFPDSAIWLRFRRLGGRRLRVSLLEHAGRQNHAECDVGEFFSAMIVGGTSFFHHLLRLDPSHRRRHQQALDRLGRLAELRAAAG